jgi:thiol-disulfide isomerase/thioredoxin
MRSGFRCLFPLPTICVLLVSASLARVSQPVTGCEPGPEVRKALDALPDYRQNPAKTDWQVYQLRLAALKALRERYPDDAFVQRKYFESTTSFRRIDKVSLEEQNKAEVDFKARHEHTPDNSQAEYLYGLTLVGRDTPQAIKLFKNALQNDADFMLPHLLLVGIYISPAFLDKKEALSHAEAFLDACPANFEGYGSLSWMGDKVVLTKYAVQLRGVLQNRTDDSAIAAYQMLWSLEFKASAASEYESLRKQVGDDIERLRRLNLENSRAWYETMEQGYKLANDQKQADWVQGERRKHFPSAGDLPEREEWLKDHPSPPDDASPAAREAYFRDLLAQTRQWLKHLPPNAVLGHFFVLGIEIDAMNHLDDVPAADMVGAVEQRLSFAGENGGAGPWSAEHSPWSDDYESAAKTLSKKHLAPERVIDYAQKALDIREFESWQPVFDLFATKESVDDQKLYQNYSNIGLLKYEADGYLQLKNSEKTELLLARMEQWLTDMRSLAGDDENKKQVYARCLADYWDLRGQDAELRGRELDAMSFYQDALLTRLDAKIKPLSDEKDELVENAHRLWVGLRGTEEAWQLWYARPANDLANTVTPNWEKASQPLAAFELTDLGGHKWNLNALKGKLTLISFWATWCGPCRQELPHLQTLVEHYKGHSDIQFISMNMDDNPGLIQPFLKEHGLSITVIPASSYISETLNVNGIPQNWIVDGQGIVRRKSGGYDSSEKWAAEMESGIEEVKAGKNAVGNEGSH